MIGLNELARRIWDVSHLTGSFRLRSGVQSGEYFDKYRFESDPILLRDVCTALLPLIPDTTQVLAGLELGGVPIATVLGQVSGLPVAFVRKSAKDYGTCRVAEGHDVAGQLVLIVEDVVTSGGSVRYALHRRVDRCIPQRNPEQDATWWLQLVTPGILFESPHRAAMWVARSIRRGAARWAVRHAWAQCPAHGMQDVVPQSSA